MVPSRSVAFLFVVMFVACSGSTDTPLTEEVHLDAPTGLTAQRIGRTAVQLTWEDKSVGEDSYAVERRTGTGTFVPLIFVPSNAVQAVDSLGLAADSVNYSYRVRALRYVSSSGYSNIVSIQFTLPYP